jgi:hypothetical protein
MEQAVGAGELLKLFHPAAEFRNEVSALISVLMIWQIG